MPSPALDKTLHQCSWKVNPAVRTVVHLKILTKASAELWTKGSLPEVKLKSTHKAARMSTLKTAQATASENREWIFKLAEGLSTEFLHDPYFCWIGWGLGNSGLLEVTGRTNSKSGVLNNQKNQGVIQMLSNHHSQVTRLKNITKPSMHNRFFLWEATKGLYGKITFTVMRSSTVTFYSCSVDIP